MKRRTGERQTVDGAQPGFETAIHTGRANPMMFCVLK